MITAREYLASCDVAWNGYAEIARELGDELISTRPEVPGTNSCFGLITHVVGVAGRWARTVNRGIVVPRDRDSEFLAQGSLDDALTLIDLGRLRLIEDVEATADFAALSVNPPADQPPETCGSILLHVYEELAQHLGQLEVTRDLLLAER